LFCIILLRYYIAFSFIAKGIIMLIQTIYIYWAQGFENAPEIVKICRDSWKTMNPTWNVVELHDTNLCDYIDITDSLSNSNIQTAAKSDIIRIALLQKWGGVWTDATCFCRVSLDKWLPKYAENGFWAFSKPEPTRLVSSWFLYGSPQNYIVQRWYKKTMNFWKKRAASQNYEYFWFHLLFNEMYKNDAHVRKMFNNTKQLSAILPHIFQSNPDEISSKLLSSFMSGKTPVYKLTYKTSKRSLNEWTTFFGNKCELLMNPISLRFLHIPKNAGTSIEEAGLTIMQKWGKYDTKLKAMNDVHAWHVPQPIGENAFCVIRNPFDKLLSEFRHEIMFAFHHNGPKFSLDANYNAQSLNHWLENSIRKVQKNPSHIDNHFLPQHYYAAHCNHILRFEHLQADFDELLVKYNLPPTQLPKLQGGDIQQKHRSKVTFSHKLTKHDISTENQQKIRSVYAIDFALWEEQNLLRTGVILEKKVEVENEKRVKFV